MHWHVFILFRSPRTAYQIGVLSRQIALADPKFIQWAYADATQLPYSYLILDFRGDSHPDLRILSKVLKENNHEVVVYK